MKTRKRFLIYLLIPLLLTGCGKKQQTVLNDPVVQKTEAAAPSVYLGESVPFPAEYRLVRTVTPRYDRDSGLLTCLAERDTDEQTEFHLLTVDAETVTEDVPVSVTKGEYVIDGVIRGDDFVFLSMSWSENDRRNEYALNSFRLSAGETNKSSGLTDFFALADRDPFFAVSYVAVDGAGRIYAASDNEIVCFGDGFFPLFSLTSPDPVFAVCTDGEGTVFACADAGNGTALVKIDPERKAFSDRTVLPDGITAFQFGEDHEAYYATNSGVWCADGLFDGDLRTAQLLDYTASRLYLAAWLCAPDEETMLFSKADADGAAIPLLYRRAEDYDPGEKTVIDLAYVGALPMWFDQKILKYNAEHLDVQIVTRDYFDAVGDGDANTAKEKLAMDLVTGLYRPDILVGAPDDSQIEQTVRSGLFADLGIYTIYDALVNDENLFGCVRRTLSDKDVRLWGLARDYEIRSILSTAELLGTYANQTSWTVEEFLDYAASLPSDKFLMNELAQENAARLLFGTEGYGAFIDAEAGTCDFTDPVFIRYLTFLKSLPATAKEARNLPQNPLSGLDREEQYQFYWTGGIALKNKWFHSLNEFLSLEIEFGTKDIVLIGQPTSYGKQAITISDVCIMTSFCENGEIAWDVIRMLIDQNDFPMNGLPVLKSDLEKKAREYYNTDFIFYFDGWETSLPKDPAHPLTNEALVKPGIFTEFTEEDAAFIMDYLDNQCGCPLTESVHEEVAAIIQEEISAFLGGVGTADSCAAKIQSRVSIWLAEHQ